MIMNDLKQKVIELWNAGHSIYTISCKLRVSVSTVCQCLTEEGIEVRPIYINIYIVVYWLLSSMVVLINTWDASL